MRKFDGTLNPDIKAQRSIHVLLGMDRWFEIRERPFKFSTEAYYKKMDDLIPTKWTTSASATAPTTRTAVRLALMRNSPGSSSRAWTVG
ncbi:MAG: hypothetical protein IPI81_11380 [Flavobacteriales bacterium]|nr:hypothetical protein [Flavobacteriales bacterium]